MIIVLCSSPMMMMSFYDVFVSFRPLFCSHGHREVNLTRGARTRLTLSEIINLWCAVSTLNVIKTMLNGQKPFDVRSTKWSSSIIISFKMTTSCTASGCSFVLTFKCIKEFHSAWLVSNIHRRRRRLSLSLISTLWSVWDSTGFFSSFFTFCRLLLNVALQWSNNKLFR